MIKQENLLHNFSKNGCMTQYKLNTNNNLNGSVVDNMYEPFNEDTFCAKNLFESTIF